MKNINKEKIYKVLSFIILFVVFGICCKYANKQSLWLDELDWTIDYLEKSHNLIELFKVLIKAGFNLPLYYVVMFPIYKIVPFGKLWLLFPNFIVVIWGIYIVNKTGNKIEKNLGFASLCISATSYVLIRYCALDFRPYTFLFCFSAYALYRYICKLQEPQKRSSILYTFSIILLAYTHWFGCLIIAFYFLADVMLWLRKKHTIFFVLPYIILGITFLPYLMMIMLRHTTNFSSYWPKIPGRKDLSRVVFDFLLSDVTICKILFIAGIIILLSYIIRKKRIDIHYIFILVGSIIWILGTTFVYSKFINPKVSFWVLRYFIVLLPHIFIITSIPIAKFLCILDNIQIKNKKTLIEKILVIGVIGFVIVLTAYKNYDKVHIFENSIYEPYREMSNLMANTPDIYEENCAWITCAGKGYITYYFEKRGIKLPYNVYELYTESNVTNAITKCVDEGKVVNSIHADLNDLLKYDKLYICQIHKKIGEDVLDFINENYDFYMVDEVLNVYLYMKK